MSDQMFIGISPKSEAGKQCYFFCMDDWLEIHQLIWTLVSDEFPVHPKLDADAAAMLSERLRRMLSYGVVRAYFMLRLRERMMLEDEINHNQNPAVDTDFDDANRPTENSLIAEDSADVVQLVKMVIEFAEFLAKCGGCITDGDED